MLCSADDACVFCERIMSSPFNDWSSSWWYSTTEIIVRNDTYSSSRYTAVVWYPSMHYQSNLVAGLLQHMVWFWIHGGIITKLHGWIYPTIISVEDYRRSGRLGDLESAGYGKSVFIRYMSWIWELRWQKVEKFLPNGFNNRRTLHPWKFQKPSICSFLLL